MVTARLTEALGGRLKPALKGEAQELARIVPRLALEARQVSAQVALGIHGRRRAGPGETFWQFRPFTSGEPADRIDWRRSARDDRLYVREREWETASTYWIWIDCSPSMGFVSSLSNAAKRDRAIVLGLAMADLLVRGGERVGLLGLTPPIVSRTIIQRLSETLVLSGEALNAEMPSGAIPGPRDRVLLFGDFIVDAEDFARNLQVLTSRGAAGACIEVRDPVETLFPFSGETEFIGPEDGGRWTVGDANTVAAGYKQRIAAHGDQLRASCTNRGWTYLSHRTDNSAAEGLLAVAMLLQHGTSASARRGG
jgi:uncharacterized protein (DUF58 family)